MTKPKRLCDIYHCEKEAIEMVTLKDNHIWHHCEEHTPKITKLPKAWKITKEEQHD